MTTSLSPPNRVPWPPIVYLTAIAAGIVLVVLYPLPWIEGPLADILFAAGWLLAAAGVFTGVAAMRVMHKANTTIKPNRVSDHLVTSGPFSFTRNPIYLGNAMITLGIGLIVGSVWFLFAGLIAAFVTQKLTIEPEERHLSARFGKKYRDYAARVRRWV
ncbi:isoprenylcysteine carboxylmethyltransferase family protein [Mesorhizobium sp. LHD-90]|uniref:methyltransferase family protein n=1 Tax=Mesorhizobium sp. LHD-90 TaxID=3071414 RepID=UPI0027DF9871|nr:isoprenylcysteine carboxylmethyltransferase family protein [Mesorhizobium sp. LHD-90]MDQ6438235.1 isoprenylcysteine carboxylmethyltransferase family protein [Mesorhizobium sp. LHD-90]